MANQSPRPNVHLSSTDDLRKPQRVFVETGALQELVQLDRAVVMGGLAINVAGFRQESGAAPDRVNWQVYASSYCDIDDEPLVSGTTFLKGGLGAQRQGLLFEVRRQAVTYFLKGYCEGNAAGVVSFSVSFFPLPQETAWPPVIAGTLIG